VAAAKALVPDGVEKHNPIRQAEEAQQQFMAIPLFLTP